MPPATTTTSSVDYINGLVFHRAESYSLQRGAAHEQEKRALVEEFRALSARKQKKNDLDTAAASRLSAVSAALGTAYLVDYEGRLHRSAQKMRSFLSTDAEVTRLRNILRTEVLDVPLWMCAPVYRDAFIFYNQWDEIVSVLNICLECEYMTISPQHRINAGERAYRLLRSFFIDIGHDVESG